MEDRVTESALALAAGAMDYGSQLGKTLDYTPGSVMALDEMLALYHESVDEVEPTESQLYSLALLFGCYLGECIRRAVPESGCHWVAVEGEPVLDQQGVRFGPVSKVYRRLIDCEEEGLIPYFHVVAGFLREGKNFD